ncbi:uncharacterized protein I206_105331 [Kwoniella pini CBS 10737]|uniref:F-box domain-containing protein n=1 Tax=Kwoniella pini CBS 10737 TaxID=1296096 RepID=A0A1B9I4I9_9TREE|nr:uncharacterized protein I206_03759 [Kwoniella pini CBS 10737]OCF50437.1 hypothetical protein I206_03759 [Kwoniella pini CBS 10737]
MTTLSEQNQVINFLDLPREILLRITSFLDFHSAVSFSTTCQAIQPIAETRVWREIHIKQNDILGIPNDSLKIPNNSKRESQIQQDGIGEDQEQEENKNLPISISDTQNGICSMRSEAVLLHLNHLLNKKKWRKIYVKSFKIELRLKIPFQLLNILKNLLNLKELKIKFPNIMIDLLQFEKFPNPQIDLIEILKNLSLEEKPLYNLENLNITILKDWKFIIKLITNCFPNLKNLNINGKFLHIRNSISTNYFYNYNNKNLLIKPLINLKSLSIEEMNSTFGSTLEKLINTSKLEILNLKDETMLWFPKENDLFLNKISKLKKLKKLKLSSNCFSNLCELNGWNNLEELTMIWSRNMIHSKDHNDIIIPPLPNLRKYYIEISPYSSSYNPYQNKPNSPSMLSTLLYQLPNSLLNSPKLHTIYCSSQTLFPNEGELQEEVIEWNNDNFQGIIIYSYINENGEELIHCRSKNHYNNEDRLKQWMGNSSSWEEHIYYKSKPLSIRVLAGMYGISGMTITNTSPGRGLYMDKKGWDLLKTWERQDESWY